MDKNYFCNKNLISFAQIKINLEDRTMSEENAYVHICTGIVYGSTNLTTHGRTAIPKFREEGEEMWINQLRNGWEGRQPLPSPGIQKLHPPVVSSVTSQFTEDKLDPGGSRPEDDIVSMWKCGKPRMWECHFQRENKKITLNGEEATNPGSGE